MKKILIINASPRVKNCYKISRNLFNMLDKNYKIARACLDELMISPCKDCGYCKYKKGCRIDDDMQTMYKAIDEADGIIIISPINFDMLHPNLMSLISRLNAIYHSKYTLNDSMIDKNKKRRGMFIYVGGSKPYEGQFEHAVHVGKFMFKAINTQYDISYRRSNTDNEEITKEEIEWLYNEFIKILNEE